MTEKNAKYYEELLKKEYPALVEYRRQKSQKMIKNVVVYEIIFALVAYGAYDYIRRSLEFWGDTSIIWKGLIIGVALAVIPPLFFKSTAEMRGKTWAGTISAIKYELRYPQPENSRSFNCRNAQEYMKMTVDVGKKKPKKLAFRSHISQALKVGDRIVKFKGFPYPAEDAESEVRYICVVCGNVVKKEVGECPRCRLPIIKLHKAAQPKDVWAQFDDNDF